MERLLSTGATAQMLGVSPRTIHRWVTESKHFCAGEVLRIGSYHKIRESAITRLQEKFLTDVM